MSQSSHPTSGRFECPDCGESDIIGFGTMIPVWERMSGYQNSRPPDYIGCTECHTMHEINGDGDL